MYWLLQWLHLFTSHMTIHCQPTLSTTFHQYKSVYPFSDLFHNYSMSNKTEIAKAITSTLCHIHLHFNNLLPDYLSSTMCPNNTNYFVNISSYQYINQDFISYHLDFQQYSSYLTSIRPINQNQLLA